MYNQICLLQSALAELFAESSSSGSITLADQYGLQAALLEEELGEEEKTCIDRLLYGVRRGWLKVGDEISTVL
jgi:hypothetical protein